MQLILLMHRTKRIAILVLTGLALTASALVGVRYNEARPYLAKQSELEDALTKAKELGVPLTKEALRERWPVRPDENAGRLLLQAFKTLSDLPRQIRQSPAELQALLDTKGIQNADFQKAMQAVSPSLDLAVEASKRPKLDFERDWEKGYHLVFKELGDTKLMVRCLGVRAQAKAIRGQYASSIEDFRGCYRIAALLGQDPTVMALTTQLTTTAIVDIAIQKALPYFATSTDALTALRETYRKERQVGDWSRALFGEAYIGIASIKVVDDWTDFAYMFSGDVGPTNPFSKIPKWMSKETVKNALLAEYLTAINEAFVAGGKPWNSAEAMQTVERMAFDRRNGRSPITAVKSILLPTFPVSDDAFTRAKAVGTCLSSLIDLYAYRAQHGSFPDTLQAAGIPDEDPYQNGKLIYRTEEDRVLLYSYGKNKIDDGGIGRTGEGGGSKDIVVWARI